MSPGPGLTPRVTGPRAPPAPRPSSAPAPAGSDPEPGTAPPSAPPARAVPQRPAALGLLFPARGRPVAERPTGTGRVSVQLGAGQSRSAASAVRAGSGRGRAERLGRLRHGESDGAPIALPGAPFVVTDKPSDQSEAAVLRLQPMSWRRCGGRPAPGPPRPPLPARAVPAALGRGAAELRGPGAAGEQREAPRTPEARSSPSALLRALGAFFRLCPLEGSGKC